MPFTLAHPAVLFPLLKRNKYFSGTALIIGSMVPDVEFIAQLQESSAYSHRFPGVILINIPLGLFLCWLFHTMIKQSLIPNLPIPFQHKFQFLLSNHWNDYARKNKFVILLSLIIGIASHLIWDAFTHQHGFGVEYFPTLKNDVIILGRTMPFYHLLQIISSVLGLGILLVIIMRLPNRPISLQKNIPFKYWMLFSTISVILLFIRFFLLPFNNGFWDVVLAFMGISMYALIISSFFHFLWLQKPMKPEP